MELVILITEELEAIVKLCASFLSSIVEFVGIVLLAFAILRQIVNIFHHKSLDFESIALDSTFNHSLSVALEVLMCGEILKTITAVTASDLMEIGILMVIRIAMSLLISYEKKHKEH